MKVPGKSSPAPAFLGPRWGGPLVPFRFPFPWHEMILGPSCLSGPVLPLGAPSLCPFFSPAGTRRKRRALWRMAVETRRRYGRGSPGVGVAWPGGSGWTPALGCILPADRGALPAVPGSHDSHASRQVSAQQDGRAQQVQGENQPLSSLHITQGPYRGHRLYCVCACMLYLCVCFC